jgi:hypothetical protein
MLRCCWLVRHIASNCWAVFEMGNVWEESVASYSRYEPVICLDGLTKSTTKLSQNSRCLTQDSNPADLEYVCTALRLLQSPRLYCHICE